MTFQKQLISYVYSIAYKDGGEYKTDTIVSDKKITKRPLYDKYAQKYGNKPMITVTRRTETYECEVERFKTVATCIESIETQLNI